MNIILLILTIILFLMIGLAFEKLCHMDYRLEEVARQLKDDIICIAKTLFGNGTSTEQIPMETRHVFEDFFANRLRGIVKPYANQAIGIDLSNQIYNGVPCIVVRFAPASDYSDEEIRKLKMLLVAELERYANARNLFHDILGDFSRDDTYIWIVLYYAELEEDKELFWERKCIYIKEHATKRTGVLCDESLNRELSAVERQEEEHEV